jgi:hypothetical protein
MVVSAAFGGQEELAEVLRVRFGDGFRVLHMLTCHVISSLEANWTLDLLNCKK